MAIYRCSETSWDTDHGLDRRSGGEGAERPPVGQADSHVTDEDFDLVKSLIMTSMDAVRPAIVRAPQVHVPKDGE